jgi:hypothetical protein
MRLIVFIRLLAYAAAIAVFAFTMRSHHLIPVGITSGSAERDTEESLPVHFLDNAQIKELPKKLEALTFPCAQAEYEKAIGI